MSDQTKWTLDTSDWPLIINDGDYCMAIIHSAESDPQRAEFRPSNADAEKAGRLMAAAPELLAACRKAWDLASEMLENGGLQEGERRWLNAIIDNARHAMHEAGVDE